MVLRLKARESRSLPGQKSQYRIMFSVSSFLSDLKSKFRAADINAGWSSPVARQAHNLKVAGSNPAPATNFLVPCWIFKSYSVVARIDVCNESL